MAQKISILTPLAYIFVMVTALAVFSTVYRKRKIQQLASVKPIYETSFARNNYFTIKSLQEQSQGGPNEIPSKLVSSALIRWAGEDVRQIIKMKQAKDTLTQLHQKGFIGDSTFTKFTTNEKAIELELQIISKEANSIKPGWETTIFNTATEVSQADGIRTRIEESQQLKEDYNKSLEKIRQRALAEYSK